MTVDGEKITKLKPKPHNTSIEYARAHLAMVRQLQALAASIPPGAPKAYKRTIEGEAFRQQCMVDRFRRRYGDQYI
jgi:hypothetical protein